MSMGVVVGDLLAVAKVGGLWAEADRRDRGTMAKFTRRRIGADQIDVLVAYVVPESAWYVLPVRVIRRMRTLKLFSGSRKRRSKFEKYREAWGFLRG